MKIRQLLEGGDHHYVFIQIPLRQEFPTMEEFDWINEFADRALAKTNGKMVGAGSGMGGRDIQWEFPTKEDAEKAMWVVKSEARKAKLQVDVRYKLANYDRG